MENDSEAEVRVTTMHPLWDEYRFPAEGSDLDQPSFYFNPYSGDLSLEMPKASSERCRGGILADEMGLGKTIMVSALLETNTPYNALDIDEIKKSESAEKSIATQSKLGNSLVLAKAARKRLPTGSPSATLIIAPVTLLDQWVNELERCSDSNAVLLYYGSGRRSLVEEIKSGKNVIVTSYGTVISEYKKFQKQEELEKESKGKGKGKAKVKDSGKKDSLLGITWFRIVLDEAHNIRNRSTSAAKATNALLADRRWALSGSESFLAI